jgi:hypothetical protein
MNTSVPENVLETLKTAACEYWKIGACIVPKKEKKPLVEWAKWQKEKQMENEFNSLPWEQADGFGVLCGTQLDNELYFCAIDFDVKNVSPEAMEKGKQALKQLPITMMEQTPSKGLHYVYFSKRKPQTISAFHNEIALELLGESKLCFMYPGVGYLKINDNTPTIVQDLEGLFYEALSSTGIKKEKKTETWFSREDLAGKPYRKATPFCIREILKGTSEGMRNETAIRLSSYFVNFRQLEQKRAFKELADWNRLNTPSLSESELKNIFESALKGRYVFGCDDDVLKGFCNDKVECLLRKKQVEKNIEKITYDPETEQQIENEVQKILDAENQLEALKPHLDNMVVGEDNTKETLVVLLRSAKEPSVKAKQIIILKATEGAGKTSLINKMIQGYKVKEVGRFSAHALDYSNLEGFEILSLKELGSMDEEKQGVSTVKFLSCDDKGYTVEITTKDEQTGKFTTEQYKIPPITVVSTTTRLILDPQFERRNWPLALDETPEQTARVKEWKAKLELEDNDKILGLRKTTSYEFSSEVYRRFIERIELKTVLIPFPKRLLDILGDEALRVRGDIDKLLTFVKLYGSMNLKRLQKIKDNIYILSPEVAVEALKIALEPLATMLTKIDKRTRQVFDVLKKIVDVKERHSESGGLVEVEIRYDHKSAQIDKSVRERIAVETKKSERTIRDFFSQLEASGYVGGDSKKPKTFTLLYDVVEMEKKITGILAKNESADNLIIEMRKEAQEWLRTRLENFFPRMGEKNISIDTNSDSDSERFFNASTEKKISNPSLIPFQTALVKTDLENRQIQKSPIPQQEKICLDMPTVCLDMPKKKEKKSENKLDENKVAANGTRGTRIKFHFDCAICLKPLPEDLFDCTVWNSLYVHTTCYRRMKDKEEIEL